MSSIATLRNCIHDFLAIPGLLITIRVTVRRAMSNVMTNSAHGYTSLRRIFTLLSLRLAVGPNAKPAKKSAIKSISQGEIFQQLAVVGKCLQ